MRNLKKWEEGYKSLNPQLNLPTKLTFLRIGLSPIFFILLMVDQFWARFGALLLFIIAAISDAYDGYLARKDGQVTKFGKIIDPIADKLLISIAFIGFYVLDQVSLWIVIVIIIREYSLTFFRILGVLKGVIIAADKWGKYKTIAQMTYIITLLVFLAFIMLFPDLPSSFYFICNIIISILLYIALILTIGSGLNYFFANRTLFRQLLNE